MKIKFMKSTFLIIVLAGTLMLSCLTSYASAPALGQQYSYSYDFWGINRESPNPYLPERVLMGVDLGIGNFKDPQGLFVGGEQGNHIFVVDSGNNRIVELDSGYNLVRVIETFMVDGQESSFSYPNDVFVSKSGEIFVADTNNQRVVHLNSGLEVIKIITKPQDALMDEIAEFLPLKLVVDNADRIYLIARNVNKGLMEFDTTGSFTGYIGANKVNFSITDMIWKIISTRAQRQQMALFVPTEYNNIFLDHKGFLYTTTAFISEDDLITLAFSDFEEESMFEKLFGLESSNVEPVRRLNAMGADILIRNGWVTPMGDWDWSDDGGVSGPSRLVDIVSNENNSYFAIDRTRGRIFGYDFQGNLLYVFGGLGNRLGYFQYPTAIEYLDGTLLVMDARSGGMTIFNPTEYGQLIHDALLTYVEGEYELSGELWEKSLVYNANQDLAYIGMGRALMRQERYKEAMVYFRMKFDQLNYSKAFQQYRKQVIENNISYIIIGVFALIIFTNGYKRVRKFMKNDKENRQAGAE